MEKFVIDGGVPLSGTIVPAGNKNGALPILAASVLTEDEVVRPQRAADPRRRGDARAARGARRRASSWRGDHEVALCAADVAADAEVDRALAERIRASFLLAGPLLARFGRAVMPPPGGDVIGRRRLDPHLDAFRALGRRRRARARHRAQRAARPARRRRVHGRAVGDGDRERADGRRAARPGTTVIGNAACEPHVQDLARMLVKMGADIQGIGSNVLTVNGAAELHGCEHTIGPDHIEIGSFMALAGVTGGELRIKDTDPGRPAHDPPGLRAPRAALRARRRRRPRPRRPGARRRSATSASTRSRSRTARGPRSRPTSRRSRSRSPRSARARSSSTSGCSRTA